MPARTHASFIVPADHPSLPGHFPGRAVVPGVVLLDAAFEQIGRVAELASVRFTRPVLPGERVELAWATAGEHADFTASVAGQIAFHGRVRLALPGLGASGP